MQLRSSEVLSHMTLYLKKNKLGASKLICPRAPRGAVHVTLAH